MLVAVALCLAAAGSSQPHHHLVAAAPGYPGDAEQAQPTMDAFAAMLAEAAGWDAGALSAEYRQREADGVAAIRERATLALVPLPLFLEHGGALDLEPLVQAVPRNGEGEIWSLVAPAGRISAPSDLAGWELFGIPAYAPAVVRGPILGHWGKLPEDVQLVFTGRILAAVRRALAGEPVAVLLDGAQTKALASLPGSESLEIVTRSRPLPSAVVAAVGDRVSADDAAALRKGLLEVHAAERFGEVLDTLRLQRFEPVDRELLERLRAQMAATP